VVLYNEVASDKQFVAVNLPVILRLYNIYLVA